MVGKMLQSQTSRDPAEHVKNQGAEGFGFAKWQSFG